MLLKKLVTMSIILLIILLTLSLVEAKNIHFNMNLRQNQREYRVEPVFIFGFIKHLNKTQNNISFYAVFTYRLCFDKEYCGFYCGNIQIKTFRGILRDNLILGSYDEYPGGW